MRHVTLGLVVVMAGAAAASPLRPRMVLAKPTHTVAQAYQAADRIVVKFSEGSGVHLRSGRLAAPAVDLTDLVAQLQAVGSSAGAMRRLFARDDAALETERAEGQRRSGRALADLSLYYEVAVPVGTDIGALCDRLNSLPYVELALPAPKPAPPPASIWRRRPLISLPLRATSRQRRAASASSTPTLVPGATAAASRSSTLNISGCSITRILELPPSANIDTATLSTRSPSTRAITARRCSVSSEPRERCQASPVSCPGRR